MVCACLHQHVTGPRQALNAEDLQSDHVADAQSSCERTCCIDRRQPEVPLQEGVQAAGNDVQASQAGMQAVRHEVITQPGLHRHQHRTVHCEICSHCQSIRKVWPQALQNLGVQ